MRRIVGVENSSNGTVDTAVAGGTEVQGAEMAAVAMLGTSHARGSPSGSQSPGQR